MPGCIYIRFYHRANNRGKYADGFYNSMIDNKDGHIPLPLIMFTGTMLCHALLEWHKNNGVYPKASKSTLTVDRPDRSNLFNYMKDGGKIASCRAATDRKLLMPHFVEDMFTFLINTCNTVPVSYQQRVYKDTLAIVKRQIQQLENPTPAVVISMEAVSVHNSILLDFLTSEVALEEHDINSTDPDIHNDNNSTDDVPDFGMPGGSGNYKHEADKSDEHDAIPTTSRRCRAATELKRIDLATSHVDRYESKDGNNADADEEEETLQADDESTQNVED
jgi:hypothetical protein